MSNILLLGAGFTYNWGGWLAREVRSKIAMRVEGHPYLRDLLNKHDSFENALEQVQSEYLLSRNSDITVARLKAFQDAIFSTFEMMNKALSRRQFEFSNVNRYSVARYLAQFDAIFSLNQDLLLERHYNDDHNISLRSNQRYNAADFPGLEPVFVADGAYHGEEHALFQKWKPKNSGFQLMARYQPIFKLHGSTNWLSPDGEQLIVMGGDKFTTIQRHPVLKWYMDQFRAFLAKPGARLTVIGYGFLDMHINTVMVEAWQTSKFPMMIVAPDGREVVRRVNRTYSKPLKVPEPLDEIVTYESTRPISGTFGNCDEAELQNLEEFLRG